jgi:hypothetical protein
VSLRIVTKLFIDGTGPNLADYVPVFHGLIQSGVLGEVLVDVADYSHVLEGPGVVLIGHESDYGIDCAKGRVGLKYQRKRAPQLATEADEVLKAFERTLTVAALLERDPRLPGLRFGTSAIELRFADRLQFPATSEGEAFARRLIQNPLAQLFPAGVTLTRIGNEKELLGFDVKPNNVEPLATLSSRVTSALN